MHMALYCVNAVLVEGGSVRAVPVTSRSKSWDLSHALYRNRAEAAL